MVREKNEGVSGVPAKEKRWSTREWTNPVQEEGQKGVVEERDDRHEQDPVLGRQVVEV